MIIGKVFYSRPMAALYFKYVIGFIIVIFYFSYHFQCLRHLYVLATKPRRLCGVNVSTNQVEPVTLKYWYKVGSWAL